MPPGRIDRNKTYDSGDADQDDRNAFADGFKWAMEVDSETRYVKTLADADFLLRTEFANPPQYEPVTIRQLVKNSL